MRTSSSAGPHSSVAAIDNIAAAAPRFFDRLDAPSKEKVTLLLSRVQDLLPIERDAFLQELSRQQEEAQRTLAASHATRGQLVRYTGPSLQAVQARDRGYVVPRAFASARPPGSLRGGNGDGESAGDAQGRGERFTSRYGVASASAAAAAAPPPPPPCSLEDLVRTPGMFGGGEEVAIHLEKMSLYDKLHQNMADTKAVTAAPDGSAGRVASSSQLSPPPASPDATSQAVQAAPPTGPYRSNAYQAVRLAMSAPGYIASQKPTSMATTQTGHDGVQSVLNTTGLPISEDDLREWFDELDEEGRGALSLEEFQRYMESLERDFGVTQEYAALQRAGEQLAFDGRLSFEAFAYLVLRFARV